MHSGRISRNREKVGVKERKGQGEAWSRVEGEADDSKRKESSAKGKDQSRERVGPPYPVHQNIPM